MNVTRIGDLAHRGVEYGVHDEGNGVRLWAYYPKMGTGVAERGRVEGTREDVIAACKAAIDEWLGPRPPNQDPIV